MSTTDSEDAGVDWVDFVENPRGIVEIFRGQVPSVDGVSIHSVSVDRNGPTVNLIFDLAGFPELPPVKWREFNTIQIELAITGVREVLLDGVDTEMVGDLHLDRMDDVRLGFESSLTRLSVVGTVVFLAKISAYLNE